MKSSETSSRQEAQNFFLPVISRGADTPSFDSFISRERQDDPRTKEIEEEEKAKKRKKAEQAAAVLATAQASTTPAPSQDDVSLGSPAVEPQKSPNLIEGNNLQKQGYIEKTPTKPTSETPTETTSEIYPKTTINEDEPAKPSIASGTEHAVESDEMISLAAMDALDAGQPAVAAKEPSITTSGRLNTFTLADRMATSGITSSQSGSNTESNLNQSGTPQLAPAPRSATTQKSPEATATSMLRSLRVEVEKFTQTNRSQLQLELPVSDSESVKVRLSMRGNELHTVFVTDSAELREALQKAWPEFSQTSRDRGFRFNDPAFQQAANQQNSPAGDREGRKHTTTSPDEPIAAVTKPKKPTSSQPTQSTPGSVSLWA